MTRVLLRQHFNDDLLVRSRTQHRIDRRQLLIKPYIHDTAAYRDHRAEIRGIRLILHSCPLVSRLMAGIYVRYPAWSRCVAPQ
ncbi:MAG: hypothetical protein Q3M30_15700 [Candidatus Electrothrix sp. Rat3]|nr:hypothetical protein [Candidatus Electrothrix rattekaaiensis]